jgi:hypothetical protein
MGPLNMAKISELPLVAATDGSEEVVVLKDGMTQRVRSSLLSQGAGDPWRNIRDKLTTLLFGTSVYADGYPTTTRTTIYFAIFGDSIGLSQGASGAFSLPAQITAIARELAPEVNVVVRVFAIAGSWQTQMAQQIDAMVAAGFEADFCFIVTGTNDGSASIFHSLEGPIVFRRELAKNIRRLARKSVVCVVSKPPPHPTNMLLDGRCDFSPDFFPTFPSTGFVAGDDKFQALTYSASEQSIANSTPGAFKAFANGWLAPGQVFRVSPDVFGEALFCHIKDWDEPGTKLFVDDGNGGPVIPYDITTLKGGYQARIDSRTQLVPARNENDLSRPVGVPADVPLAIEPRDINANGVLIDMSLRHVVIERITEEVAIQEGALFLPWGREIKKLLTSNLVYKRIYTGSEAYHPNDEVFALWGKCFRHLLAQLLYDLDLSFTY